MAQKKAIIIGSGVAGLAISIRLACEGLNVVVFEKNDLPGGKLSGFKENGFHFDSGPSLFTEPSNIEALFELAGEDISDYLKYEKIQSSCKYFFENNKVINAYTDRNRFASEVLEQVGEKSEHITQYLKRSERVYKNIGSIFLDQPIQNKRIWFQKPIIDALATLRFPYLFSTLAVYNNKRFATAEVRQIFNRFATYNGSNPFTAPAMLNLIPHLELNEGTYYPQGGMISITNALYQLALKKGVGFHFNTPVEKIIHTAGRISGVVVNKTNALADIVVSNTDIYFTTRDLLGFSDKAKKILKQERSSSAIIFYWGINGIHPELDLHNIFFSRNYKEEFTCIFNKKTISNDPTVYVNITSKMEASHVPEGNENWFVMINVPHNIGQDWGAIKIKARKIIIEKLERILNTDIESKIVFEKSMDPVEIETNTGSYMGAIYGASSNSKMAAFFRPPNSSSFMKGLYFCGGSVHPGGGIPLCLKSAKITSELIRKDLKSYQHA